MEPNKTILEYNVDITIITIPIAIIVFIIIIPNIDCNLHYQHHHLIHWKSAPPNRVLGRQYFNNGPNFSAENH